MFQVLTGCESCSENKQVQCFGDRILSAGHRTDLAPAAIRNSLHVETNLAGGVGTIERLWNCEENHAPGLNSLRSLDN